MTRARERDPLLADVTVILGDPRLPDHTKVNHVYSPEDLDSVERMKAALAELAGSRFGYLDDHTTLVGDLVAAPPPFVLNLCDTGFRNDPAREKLVPALLDLLEVPYTGAGPDGMSLCYDKALVHAVAVAHGVPAPHEIFVDPADPAAERAAALPSGWPALVKPCRGDGSVGITAGSVVAGPSEARRCLDRLLHDWPGRGALVQEFLGGPEYSIALIGNPETGFRVLPALEVDYSGLDPGLPPILSYESKTVPESPYWTRIRFRQARLGGRTLDRLVGHCEVLFDRLCCRDYARFDFRADEAGEIKLLEVNPNPAWCWDGKLNIMAGLGGTSYPGLLEAILEAARRRLTRACAERCGPSSA